MVAFILRQVGPGIRGGRWMGSRVGRGKAAPGPCSRDLAWSWAGDREGTATAGRVRRGVHLQPGLPEGEVAAQTYPSQDPSMCTVPRTLKSEALPPFPSPPPRPSRVPPRPQGSGPTSSCLRPASGNSTSFFPNPCHVRSRMATHPSRLILCILSFHGSTPSEPEPQSTHTHSGPQLWVGKSAHPSGLAPLPHRPRLLQPPPLPGLWSRASAPRHPQHLVAGSHRLLPPERHFQPPGERHGGV